MTYRLRSHWIGLVLLAVSIAFLVSVPAWGSGYLKRTIVEFIYLLALAQAWNLMAGYGGMLSIGQQGWLGIGAYALVVLAEDLGINPFLAIPLAGLVVAALAWPSTLLLFRLRGAYFAVGTWVLAEVLRLAVTANIDWLGGAKGRSVRSLMNYDRFMRENLTYIVCLLLAAGGLAAIYFALRSKTGLALTAIRDSEPGASGVGIKVLRTKRFVYVVASGFTGALGALIYANLLSVSPDAAFSLNWTAYVIFIVVIGGVGTLEGPIIGTAVFFLLRQFLFGFQEWSLIIFGGIAVTVMIVAPQGLWGLVKQRFDFELLPVRRRLPARLITEPSAVRAADRLDPA
ncbi:MAG: hypothetical protein JWR51_95 [Devosia sp.]|uniref:branched-chain amino acid ABC transporter permease n=1 Tax=Devosia sp. TaxID=1871048 RepID=UPI00260A6A6D|nr:branched-chain amino acid ABC transporter permease [Devosia sp.]MDB5526992.1 hypothetical protein [Devosia sp.]